MDGVVSKAAAFMTMSLPLEQLTDSRGELGIFPPASQTNRGQDNAYTEDHGSDRDMRRRNVCSFVTPDRPGTQSDLRREEKNPAARQALERIRFGQEPADAKPECDYTERNQ